MVKYIITRPIAVFMFLISFLVLGGVAMSLMPVSLMPSVKIPKITVKYTANGLSASDIENTLLKQVRSILMQTSHFKDVRSEATDGYATLEIDYEYGTNVDLAFIDVNEKLDRIADAFPTIPRPKVIKASATDIPVFYIDITLNDSSNNSYDSIAVTNRFIELGGFVNSVVRKRIEQLADVAMVDMSGTIRSEIVVIPDQQKLIAHNISIYELEQAIQESNVSSGNITIQDGYYRFNIILGNKLTNIDDLENIYITVKNKVVTLKELAQVKSQAQKIVGRTFHNGKPSISLAVIKQSNAQMGELKSSIDDLIHLMEQDYPDVSFNITQNQTRLLDFSIDNLQQSLIYGSLLAIFIMFFFLRDFRAPLLIIISIPTSLTISMLSLYMIGISINIISLSGLILGVGMMIDNAIIVIDNINQHHLKTNNILKSCILGTNEVFSPLLSSVLTTCSVFIPLIFMPGITGALFFDQAMSIGVGLLVSLVISVTVLPVLYHLIYKDKAIHESALLKYINQINYTKLYHKGILYSFRHIKGLFIISICMIGGSILLINILPKELFPQYSQDETLLRIDWNEKISLNENIKRSENLVNTCKEFIQEYTLLSGIQAYVLNNHNLNEESQSVIYLRCYNNNQLSILKERLSASLNQTHNEAIYEFQVVDNLFEKLFGSHKPYLEARFRTTRELGKDYTTELHAIIEEVDSLLGTNARAHIPIQNRKIFKIDRSKLMAYNIDYNTLFKTLKMAFQEDEILILNKGSEFTPVILGYEQTSLSSIINNLKIKNKSGSEVAISNLIELMDEGGLKKIIAGVEGEYYPITITEKEGDIEEPMTKIIKKIEDNESFEVSFVGSHFDNRELIKSMGIIFLISLSLLYFILAAEFESLLLPLIVLIEIPISAFGALFLLYLFNMSINLMSMIGIVVMSGIVINDSILKIDTIIRLRKEGFGLLKSIILAGNRRLNAILMTSLTTILALAPILFMQGMGAEIQKPLAITVIGSMCLGTIVSLFFIPLCYYFIDKYISKN